MPQTSRIRCGLRPWVAAVALIGLSVSANWASAQFDPFHVSPYSNPYAGLYGPDVNGRPALDTGGASSRRRAANQLEGLRLLEDIYRQNPLGEDPLRKFNSGSARATRGSAYRNSMAARTDREYYDRVAKADALYMEALRETDLKKRDQLLKEYKEIRDEVDKEVRDVRRGKKSTSSFALPNDEDLPQVENPRVSAEAARGAKKSTKSTTTKTDALARGSKSSVSSTARNLPTAPTARSTTNPAANTKKAATGTGSSSTARTPQKPSATSKPEDALKKSIERTRPNPPKPAAEGAARDRSALVNPPSSTIR